MRNGPDLANSYVSDEARSILSGDGVMQWHRRTSVFQQGRIAIDPLADWDIGAVRSQKRAVSKVNTAENALKAVDDETQDIALLIRLKDGIAASALDAYINSAASGLQAKAIILPVYSKAGGFWADARYCTARVSKAFMDALVSNSELEQRIESVTLSIEPRPLNTDLILAGGIRNKPRIEDDSVILGVIDHGIPIAHATLRNAAGLRTRLLAAWLQDAKVGTASNGQKILQPSVFAYGADFMQEEVNDLLSFAGGDESAFYRASRMFMPDRRETYWTMQHVTHGSAILGLLTDTTGKPEGHAEARPVICVQLPEKSVADGSGHSLAVNVVDGLRYIADIAEKTRKNGDLNVAPVVVTLSYGNNAGPHDGRSDLELAIEEISVLWNKQHPQSPFVIVVPAGNSFQSQGHAVWRRDDVTSREPEAGTLTWDIMPDDATASIVQFWLPESMVNPQLKIQTPGGVAVVLDTTSSTFFELRGVDGSVALAQALYCPARANRSKRLFQIVVGPTLDPEYEGLAGPATAPAGFWQLQLRADDMGELDEAHAWIERDDRPLRSGRQGRQSRFSHADYQPIQPSLQPADGTLEHGLIRRPGSMNGLANGYGTIVVGAALANDGIASLAGETSSYSGGSASGTGGQPVDFTVSCDHSAVVLGQISSGVASGSFARLYGTSMAAPLAARSIADHIGMFTASHAKLAVTGFMLMAGGTLKSPEPEQLKPTNQDRDGIGFLPLP